MDAALRTALLSPAQGGGSWTPARLGASLYDMWDAERSGDLALTGAAVTGWASARNGYPAAQTASNAKPAYGATSFNGRPGVTFDGVDDELTYAGTGVLPTGAAPGEIWVLADQTAVAADAATRSALTYGNATNVARSVRRSVQAGVNRFAGSVGDGAATLSNTNTAVDLSGRHVMRLVVTGTQQRAEVDGLSAAASAVVPATAVNRTRLGATSSTTAAGFWSGVLAFAAITDLLSIEEAAQMLAYLKARGGIA